MLVARWWYSGGATMLLAGLVLAGLVLAGVASLFIRKVFDSYVRRA